MPDNLSMWTVYARPTDYPDEFVARRWEVAPTGPQATQDLRRADTLENLRRLLPPDLYVLPRQPGDDPKIVEVWL